jgi:hypothetical protein
MTKVFLCALNVPSTEFILSAAEGLRTWLGAINFLTRFVKQFAGALRALTSGSTTKQSLLSNGQLLAPHDRRKIRRISWEK